MKGTSWPPPKILPTEIADKTTQQQMHAAFHEKGKVMTQKAEPRILVDYSQTLESNQGTGISLLS